MLHCFYLSLLLNRAYSTCSQDTCFMVFVCFFLFMTHSGQIHNPTCTFLSWRNTFLLVAVRYFPFLYQHKDLCMAHSVFRSQHYNQTKQMLPESFTSLKSCFPAEFTLSTLSSTNCWQVCLEWLPCRSSQIDTAQPPLSILSFHFYGSFLQIELLGHHDAMPSKIGDLKNRLSYFLGSGFYFLSAMCFLIMQPFV